MTQIHIHYLSSSSIAPPCLQCQLAYSSYFYKKIKWIKILYPQMFLIKEFRSWLSKTCFSISAHGISQFEKRGYLFLKCKLNYLLTCVLLLLILRKNCSSKSTNALEMRIYVQEFSIWVPLLKSKESALRLRILFKK